MTTFESILGYKYLLQEQASIMNDTDSVVTGQRYNDMVLQTCQKQTNSTSYNCSAYEGLGYVVGVNFTALHASLLFQSLADEAIMRSALSDDEYEIQTTIHPLPLTKMEKGLKMSEDSFTAW